MSDYKTEVLALNPVGYWRLGEASGTNAVDLGSGANDGTYNGSPTLGVAGLLTGDADTAVTLNAATKFVDMTDVHGFDFSDAFTLTAWVKSSAAAAQNIMGKNPGAGAGYEIAFRATGEIDFAISAVSYPANVVHVKTTSTAFTDGNVHHVCATYDGSSSASGVHIYVDGIDETLTIVQDTVTSGTATNTDPFRAGNRASGTGRHFQGDMDEPAVFDKELTAKNVARLYHTGKGVLDRYPQDVMGLIPAGYWRLGEASGTNAVDEVGTNDGTYTNTPTLGVTGALTNDADTAVTFASASSEHVIVGDVLDFDQTDPFSMSAWFKSSTAAIQFIISKQASGVPNRGYSLYIRSTGELVFHLCNDSATNSLRTDTGASVYLDGLWHNVVVTYDGSTNVSGVTIYVDGLSVALTPDFDTLSATTVSATSLAIAIRGDTAQDFPMDGEVDEAAIFAHELSAVEALFLYDSGVFVAPPAGVDDDYRNKVLSLRPLGYWRLGEASGTNCADEMLRNDGTYVNTPTLGVTGALTGDTDTAVTCAKASSEHVVMGDVLDQDYNDSYTMACWIKTTEAASISMTVMGKQLDATTNRGYRLYVEGSGKVRVHICSTGASDDMVVDSVVTVRDGNWHFLVVSYDGSTNASGVTIYVDGVAVAMTIVRDVMGASSTLSSAQFDIGGRNNGVDDPWEGSLDDIAIFGYELTAKDVAAMYYKGLNRSGYDYEVLSLAPTSYWRLGEASGTNAVDEVGNHAGTYVNTPTLGATSLVPAEPGDTAVTFVSANSEAVDAGDVLNFLYNEPWSVCLWVNTSTTLGNLVRKYDNGLFKGFILAINAGVPKLTYKSTSITSDLQVTWDAAVVNDSADHFMVMTYDGSTNASGAILYVDGIKQVPTVVYDSLSASPAITAPFKIGFNLDGTMDEVAVFEHELPAAEARRMYIAGLDKHGEDYAGEVLALGPVGYWRLGEASGTNAVDELGVNDGTYVNTPTLGVTGALTGDTDTAVTFASASSEYATMGDVLSFEYDEPFTLSGWFKTGTAAAQVLFGKEEDVSNKRGYLLYIKATGALRFQLVNVIATTDLVTDTTSTAFADDAWHHVVVTYSGNNLDSGVTIYVDGVEEAKTNVRDGLGTNTTVSAASFVLGSQDTTSTYMDGEIDEAAIFDYELTAADAARMYWRGKGSTRYSLAAITEAVGYWRLGEASGTNAVDETGNNAGTYTNTPTLGVASGVPNDTDTAVLFTAASSEYATMGDVLDFDYNEPFTLGAWINTGYSAAVQGIIRKSDSAGNFTGYGVVVQTTGSIEYQLKGVSGGLLQVKTTSTTWADGAWHNVVVTYDGSTNASGVNIYVDGVNEALTTVSDTLSSSTLTAIPLQIGARNSASNFFEGSIDDAAVYDVELTANQVADMYIAGLLSYTEEAAGNGTTYDEAVTDGPSIEGVLGANAFNSVTESTTLVTVLATHWSKRVTESFNWETGIGLLTSITDTFHGAASATTIRNLIGSVVESVQLALTQNIEHAKGIVEALAMNETWVGGLLLQGNLEDNLSTADIIRLAWDQLQTETMNVTDSNAVYARKAGQLAELFVSAGLVSTIHKAAGIIAEAVILQDLVERFFELSAIDGITLSDTDVALYRAVAINIEAAAMSDVIAGGMRLSLIVSDELVGDDTVSPAQRLQAALDDNAVFGGAIILPDGVFTAVVMNTESLGISEYSNYPFNSFGKLGQDYLGASDVAIFKLTGDDDAGTDIDAVIRTSMTNFGTNVFKRVPRAYLGYTSSGGMIMKTISTSGGVKTERWYELTPRTGDNLSDAHATARIQLGRGIKATYWQFELINKLGADFDIDSLQLYPMILKRRV